jgi:hypothetical protein
MIISVRADTEDAGAGKSVESDDVAVGDDEEQHDEVHSADPHESMPAQHRDLIDSVPPFISPTSWMVMANPASSDALKAFQWKGERLALKFEGGWSTASYRRGCNRREAPEGYDLRSASCYCPCTIDNSTKQIAHMLDLQEYGVTRNW